MTRFERLMVKWHLMKEMPDFRPAPIPEPPPSSSQRLADHIDATVDKFMDSLTEEQRLAGVTRVAVLGAIVQRPTCQSCAFFLAPGRCMHDLGGFRVCSHDDWCHNHPFMQIYIEILTLDPWALKTAMVRFDQPDMPTIPTK